MEATSRSRSRSRDRDSRGSDSDEERRRRRKRSEDRRDKKAKKEKKEKKAHKKHKTHKRSRRDSSSEDERSEISETSQSRSIQSSAAEMVEMAEMAEIAESKVPEPTSDGSATSGAPKISRHQFFAQLLAKEGSKGSKTVGTVHALGKKDEQPGQQSANTGDWECYKCGTSNFRHNIQCHKCKAMKRLTEWR